MAHSLMYRNPLASLQAMCLLPRYVILEHDQPILHWDFMLESGGALRTWRLARPAEFDTPIRATPLADHRLQYLDYEGPVSGGRGTVTRWDRGEFEWITESEAAVVVALAGSRLKGYAHLRRDDEGAFWFRLTLELDPDESLATRSGELPEERPAK